MTLSRFERWYGRDEPPRQLRWLRAGALDVALDGADLRYVRMGRDELVRRVYVAVRDLNWDTIGEVERETEVHETEGGFLVRSRVRNRRHPIDFSWDGTIEGSSDGSITYSLDGRCDSAFQFAKIGICVHHPIRECAGRPYTATTPDGVIDGTLPLTIGAQIFDHEKGYDLPLFDPFSALSIELEGGTAVDFAFEGQLFEMEDQRNWSDASLKTQSTPAYLGYVHRAEPGRQISQRVVIHHRLAQKPLAVARRSTTPAGSNAVTLGQALRRRLPSIGFCVPSDGSGHTEHERARIRALRPTHLRADVQAEDVGSLEHALELCAGVDAQLELALHVDAARMEAIASLSDRLAHGSLARIIVFQNDHATTPRATIETVRRYLPSGVPIVGGTTANFCEVNRDRPDIAGLDGLSYSINSQVHAFDELSLVEALAGHAETVVSARAVFPGVPIIVSPVTLRPRFNPAAVTPEPTPDEAELPLDVDPRQMAQFGAVWTLGSVKALSESETASLTYYETIGWRGLVERDAGNPQPALFRSTPGMMFPIYGTFMALRESADAELVSLIPDDPLAVTGLALGARDGIRLIVGNLTHEPLTVALASHRLTIELEPYAVRSVLAGEPSFR